MMDLPFFSIHGNDLAALEAVFADHDKQIREKKAKKEKISIPLHRRSPTLLALQNALRSGPATSELDLTGCKGSHCRQPISNKACSTDTQKHPGSPLRYQIQIDEGQEEQQRKRTCFPASEERTVCDDVNLETESSAVASIPFIVSSNAQLRRSGRGTWQVEVTSYSTRSKQFDVGRQSGSHLSSTVISSRASLLIFTKLHAPLRPPRASVRPRPHSVTGIPQSSHSCNGEMPFRFNESSCASRKRSISAPLDPSIMEDDEDTLE